MTRRVWQILTQVEDMLLEANQDGADLWAILSALRGPDKPEDQVIKRHTTIPIRRLAFPRIAEASDKVKKDLSGVSNVEYRISADFHGENTISGLNDGLHFSSHICKAKYAIERVEPTNGITT